MSFKFYGGFYNYVSRKTNILVPLAHTLFMVCCLILLSNHEIIFSDKEILLTTFSTIMQGFLALVGFLGTVAVFKLQLIENEVNQTLDKINPFLNEFEGVHVYGFVLHETIKTANEILINRERYTGPEHYFEHIKFGVAKLKSFSDTKDLVRNLMVDFSLLSLISIVLALLGIPLSKLALTYCLILPITLYLFFNIFLSYISIITAFNLLRRCIGYSFRMKAY